MFSSLRQCTSWLHTWTGLVVGWVLLFVFVPGTPGYFQQELSVRWEEIPQPGHEWGRGGWIRQPVPSFHPSRSHVPRPPLWRGSMSRGPPMLRTESITAHALLALALALALGSTTAFAHEPVARCFLLDETTVRCRGASNDGEEMPGSRMEVITLNGAPLLEGKLGADSTWTFRKPTQPFYVLFDTGPGLQVTVEQEKITAPPRGKTPRWMRTP